MVMQKKLGLLVMVACAGASAANAAELGFMGAAGLQYKQLTLEQTFSGELGDLAGGKSGDLTATLPALTLQGIAFYDKYFTALKVEAGLSTEGVDSDVPYTAGNSNLSTDVGRGDFSITVGYKAWQDLSIFGGYMAGKTELTPAATACTALDDCPNLASEMAASRKGEYRQNYNESGFFVGTSYGWAIAGGRLSASIAYAMMNGKYSDNFITSDGDSGLQFDYEGDSNGLSIAGNWSAPINDRFGYFVDARLQRYSMDASDKTNVDQFKRTSVKTDEQLLGVTAGIQAFF